jgi:hypothetical protein
VINIPNRVTVAGGRQLRGPGEGDSSFPYFSHRIFAPRAPIWRLLTLVNLSVEVSGEGGAFTVPVRAESIRRAAEYVAYSFPGSEVRVVFAIDKDGFFADDGASKSSEPRRWRHPWGK